MTGRCLSERAASGPESLFTDASCVHAALGTLLLELDPSADIVTALGSECNTQAVGGELLPAFTRALPTPLSALRRKGYAVEQLPLDEEGQTALLGALSQDGAVVVDVDTFHLPHHWVDYGRLHSLHAVVLRDFDPVGRTVRLTDPVDVTWFDSRVPWSLLQASVTGTAMGQSWLRVTPAPPGAGQGVDFTHLSLQAAALCGDLPGQLSGSALARELKTALDRFFPSDPGAEPLPSDWISHVQHGLWSYHHTLRWFAKYLATLSGEGGFRVDEAASEVERASQDWLVVRALLRHSGFPVPEPAMMRYRSEVARRLDRITEDLSRAGEALAAPGARAQA
ncbi:hypothetical protein [Streptomyces sp. NPDC058092]|uniref:hypothetical protein n=1 Tax=Streptomyces sp. NPDC058092 TaxID=3346336 RepID=UPI0036E13DCE